MVVGAIKSQGKELDISKLGFILCKATQWFVARQQGMKSEY